MDISYALIAQFIVKIVRIVVLAVLGYYGMQWLEKSVHRYLSRLYPDELRSLLVARLLAYAYLFIIATALLHEFDINLAALLGAAGIIGLAIAYAAQASISNIVSGLLLAVERPFEVHDTIKIGSTEGTIEKINLFAVTICLPDGTLMRVPNEQLLKNPFINVTRLPTRRFEFHVPVAADQDINRVVNVIKEALVRAPYANRQEPMVRIIYLAYDCVLIKIGVWTRQDTMSAIKDTVPLLLKQALDRQEIRLARTQGGCCDGRIDATE